MNRKVISPVLLIAINVRGHIENLLNMMKKFEKFIGTYKNTINLFGIVIALGALIYAGVNANLTYKALTSDLKEYQEKNTPLFDFSISRIENKISNETITIRPINSDISLNKVYLYFSRNDRPDTFEILVPQNYKLKDFKTKITNELKEYYCDNCLAYSNYTCIPIGIKFKYFQFGEMKELIGLFKLTCKVHINYGSFGISLRHIEFLKYYNNQSIEFLWDDLETFSYENCYKKSFKEVLEEKKKLEIIKKDKVYNSAYELLQILSEYYNYKIIYEPIDSIQEYKFNYFLGVDSVKMRYNDLISQWNITYSKMNRKNPIAGRQYLILIDFLKKMNLPESTDFEKIIKSQWVDKSMNDSITIYRDQLRKTIINSIEYAP